MSHVNCRSSPFCSYFLCLPWPIFGQGNSCPLRADLLLTFYPKLLLSRFRFRKPTLCKTTTGSAPQPRRLRGGYLLDRLKVGQMSFWEFDINSRDIYLVDRLSQPKPKAYSKMTPLLQFSPNWNDDMRVIGSLTYKA